MALNVPAKLKSAEISRFAQRAAQVESLKPAIAYWCYYWIVQHILANGMHTADDGAKAFTTNLMDRLEEMKVQHATDDAITDDVAGQAYVEQFGLETFQRADNAVRAGRATRQTADTFQASTTFLELVSIWGAPSPEITAKIKYAKFHALRIAKAIKAGEDPNLSNPAHDIDSRATVVPLDPNDPEVLEINGALDRSNPAEASSEQTGGPDPSLDSSTQVQGESAHPRTPSVWPETRHQQPSVAEIPDEHDRLQRSLAGQSVLDESLHPSRAPSVPRHPPVDQVGDITSIDTDQTSPHHPETNPLARQGSVGGYFPAVALPEATVDSQAPITGESGDAGTPPKYFQPHPQSITSGDRSFYPSAPTGGSIERALPSSVPLPSRQTDQQHSLRRPQQESSLPQQMYQQPPLQQDESQTLLNASQTYLSDDAAVMAAQKHAKFAISALNFEDVPTAVKELREALQSLGAI